MRRKVPAKIRLKLAIATAGAKIASTKRKMLTRGSIANMLMFSFILLSALGAGMIYTPAGLITAGVCCGLFGFLLGSE